MNFFLIYPTQLFDYKYVKSDIQKYKIDKVFIIEDDNYFTKYKFHRLKLVFHRASMKYYYDYLISNKNHVEYYEYTDNYLQHLKNKNIYFYNPVDRNIIKKLNDGCKKYQYKLTMLETPEFITTYEELAEYDKLQKGKKFMHDSSFYKWQKKRLNILVDIKSQDKENRESFSKTQKDVFSPKITNSKYIIEAKKYITKHFNSNWGDIDNCVYPIDHHGAKLWLLDFIKNRLTNFGKYEDAFQSNINFGFHSVLSPLLNIGLLTDRDILDAITPYIKSKKVPINSLEGYIRQLIGWKQSMRYLYEFHFNKFYGKNFLKHTNKISRKFWDATTGIPPIDNCINKAKQYGYLHHIERLMVMGQFFLLTMINPKDVYDWFISLVSMDSYEWVMIPNIYGMIMYADGGFMMSRPYFSSSAYIKKMSGGQKQSQNAESKIKLSDGKEYSWDAIWDALYYNLIYKHRTIFKKIYATARNVYHWDNKTKKEKDEFIHLAALYIKWLK
jgi:deoxyribodipyrimidine photolyase-related protein